MKFRVSMLAALLCTASFAACGGGGGTVPMSAPSSLPPPSPSSTDSTNASGIVVNDASGKPLGGVRVAIEPWVADATPLPAPQATTDANGRFTLSAAPNGHYLLVIGDDTPGDIAMATIHDNVTLAGGNQTLSAPTLPTIPGYDAPRWETNGSYRLATPDPTTEIPCYTSWNSERTQRSLKPAVVDEWLLENVRAELRYSALSPLPPNNGFLTALGQQLVEGSSVSCGAMITSEFAGVTATNLAANSPEVRWLGAALNVVNGESDGFDELPYDPRFQKDLLGLWL